MEDIEWWHSIDLGNGLITPGRVNSRLTLKNLHLPGLEGKTVLDVGAWDGFYSFECEKKGAKKVLATDSFEWERRTGKQGFDYAKEALGSKVESMLIDVLELGPESVGQWDIVLFLGILYHMKHPLLALERVSSICKEMLILETHTDARLCRKPSMVFYPKNESYNWWGPNVVCVREMLKEVGFKGVRVVARYPGILDILYEALLRGDKGKQRTKGNPLYRRVVFHAFK